MIRRVTGGVFERSLRFPPPRPGSTPPSVRRDLGTNVRHNEIAGAAAGAAIGASVVVAVVEESLGGVQTSLGVVDCMAVIGETWTETGVIGAFTTGTGATGAFLVVFTGAFDTGTTGTLSTATGTLVVVGTGLETGRAAVLPPLATELLLLTLL